MLLYAEAFLIALLCATALTPVVRVAAIRRGLVSAPHGRHLHATPVPRLGGLAVLAAFMISIVIAYLRYPGIAHVVQSDLLRSTAVFAGGVALAILGLLDDTRGLRASHKLLAQVGIAVAAYYCGLQIRTATVPVFGSVSMGIASLPVTVLWIVGIVNAVNLIDGLDGLAGGIVLFAGLTNVVVSFLSHSPFIALTMSALSGAVLGFLFFNFNPARIFLGDSGSYFLGYVLSTAVLVGYESQKTSTAIGLLVPCLALGVPIFDTLFSVVRRFLERRPLFAPDRGHIHHRLLDLGLTQRRAVLLIYALSIVFCTTAVAFKLGGEWHIGVAIACLSIVVVLFLRFAGYIEYVRARIVAGRNTVRSPLLQLLRATLATAPIDFSIADGDDEIRAALERLARTLQLGKLAVGAHEVSAEPIDSDDCGVSIALSSNPRAEVRFEWPRSNGDCTPEVQILLQVLVDMIELHLARSAPMPLLTVSPRATPSAPAAAPSMGPHTLSAALHSPRGGTP